MLSMTHDHNGQLHAGAIGLFDDPDEIAYSEARATGRQVLAESKARKRKEKRQRREDERKVRSYERPGLIQRMSRIFGSEKEDKRDEGGTDHLLEKKKEKEDVRENKPDRAVKDTNAVQMYDECEVDTALDSPFYEELGLVRIRAGNARDVKIVHKSQICSSEPLADYGE